MQDLANNFTKYGYLVAPNFIDQNKVQQLRAESELLLEQQKDFTLKPTSLLQNPIMTSIIFSRHFLDVLNALSSEYRYFLPNFTVRKNLFIGWHTDDEFVEPDQDILPGVLQCNIYLQSNLGNNGGGIDVAVSTQKLPADEKKRLIQNDNNISFVSAQTQAGDLLIFDYRVIHRSSTQEQPLNQSRLALQWTVCRSQQHAYTFMQYLLRRQKEKLHLSDFTNKRALGYFFDAANVIYPTSFDADTREIICSSSITVPSFLEVTI